MYEWVIIGGGIHGCTIANFLLKSGKTIGSKLLIIDPNPEPMSKWKQNTEKIDMEFLRSPSVHHIDLDPLGLQKYASERKEERGFYGPYNRPSLQLFNEHCKEILINQNLLQSWYQGTVNNVEKDEESWLIHTAEGKGVRGKNIVIAVSINHQLNIPEWVKLYHSEDKQIYHVFDDNLRNLENLQTPITVIGGGITAAHLTLKLCKLYPEKVTLLKRHSFRVNSFDSAPGWLGPKYLSGYAKIKDYDKRRTVIQEARNKGSIPRELYIRLMRLKKEMKLSIINGETVSAAKTPENDLLLHLKNDIKIKTKTVLLATGFVSELPGDGWLHKLIKKENLQCANCGYPIVKQTLEWCQHLYVAGPLAELEIGPVSRNIAGARKAAERITASIS